MASLIMLVLIQVWCVAQFALIFSNRELSGRGSDLGLSESSMVPVSQSTSGLIQQSHGSSKMMFSGPRSIIRKSSFLVYLELMFMVNWAKWVSEPALLIEPSILYKAIGLVSGQRRMLCCVINLLLIKTAIILESSMAR
jgi:hypothetical protein